MSFIVAKCEDYTLKKCEPFHLVRHFLDYGFTTIISRGVFALARLPLKNLTPPRDRALKKLIVSASEQYQVQPTVI
jgi:hypothetical protein